MIEVLRRALAYSPLARIHVYEQHAGGFMGWVSVFGVTVAYIPADGTHWVTSW